MKFLCATDYALCQLEVTEIGKVIKRNIEIKEEKFSKECRKNESRHHNIKYKPKGCKATGMSQGKK
jgi:hypothetical protein